MVTKKCIGIGAGILLVWVMLAGGFVSPKPAIAVELTFQHLVPSVGLMSDEYRKWGDLVEKRTEGRIKIKWYWSNSLFSLTQALPSIAQGVADLGIVSGAYFPTQLPTVLVFEHAYNASDLWVGMRAQDNLYLKRMPELQKEFAAHGIMWLAPYTSGTFQWFVKGDWKGPESFKGKIGRTMGGARKLFYEKLGMKPVFLSSTDIYEAVERGTIWGFDNTLNLANDLKQYEVVNTLVLLNSGVVMSSGTFMNLKKFQSLPKKDQDALVAASVEWGENIIARNIYEKEKLLVKEWRDRGINVITPTEKQAAELKKLGRDSAMEVAVAQDKKMGPQGKAVQALKALWDEVGKAEKELKEKGHPWK